jgi:hypothetical protein
MSHKTYVEGKPFAVGDLTITFEVRVVEGTLAMVRSIPTAKVAFTHSKGDTNYYLVTITKDITDDITANRLRQALCGQFGCQC